MTLFSLVVWAAFGAVVGGIARALVPGKMPAGWLPTILLGCLGSIVGGLPFGHGNAGLVGSIVGAVVVVCLHSWYTEGQS
jgi:uncharacterized membrane protein YeaQ/YmgE (transglycosylase-associated protein family)